MTQPSIFARLLRRLTLALVLALGFSLPFGCTTEEATCDGVLIDGVCEPKCDSKTCAVPGSTCFRNACAAPCQAHEACPAGQNCANLAADDKVTQGTFCYILPFAKDGLTGQFDPCVDNSVCDVERGFECISGVCAPPCKVHSDCVKFQGYCATDANGASSCVKSDGPPPGRSGACSSSTECDQAGGYKCVDSECRLAGCRTHDDCVEVGLCKPGKLENGDKTTACVKGTVHPKGQYGTRCTEGAAAAECDEANGFVCIGAGPGDVDAYCTGTACSGDSACPEGFFCSSVRTGRPPCEATCTGLTPVPTDSNCVKPADIGAGKAYSCGPINLLRNLCLKRRYCNDCESDVDCLALPNQVCAKDSKGNKKCSVICDENVSGACPWGTASSCALTDTDLGVPTCSHRFGACEAEGKSCEPCIDDADCPNGLCASSDFTQERYCLDLSVTCDCTGLPLTQGQYCLGGGCPKTPGGLNMRCFGGSGVPATSLLLNKCFGASIQQQFGGSPQTACWPK